jgi:hypothetical protein
VDGELVGSTPLGASLPLDLGTRTIVVRKAGFQTFTKAVSVGGGTEQSVAAVLAPEAHLGQLVVVADGASTVFVDAGGGERARFEGRLSAGPHHIRVTEPGMVAYQTDVDLRDGETRVLEVALTPQGAPVWPWIVGGLAAAGGAAVGGYFLFRPQDRTLPVPTATLQGADVHFMTWRGR